MISKSFRKAKKMISDKKRAQILKQVETKEPVFMETVQNLDVEALEQNLLRYAKYREETLAAQASDPQLIEAKEVVKELNRTFVDALGSLKTKLAYLNLLLEDKKAE